MQHVAKVLFLWRCFNTEDVLLGLQIKVGLLVQSQNLQWSLTILIILSMFLCG